MFIARERGQTMILCKAYKAAGVTDTTGRRLLDRMEEEGLVTRRRAPRSRKMRIVELTEKAVERLVAYLGRGL
jgi:DNA-binding MarR family transcriptional regulator